MRTIYRVNVPVDAEWHKISLQGPILHVATRYFDLVEVWFLHDDTTETRVREVRVYGTGQPDTEGTHVGTAIAPGGDLVWHLMERGNV